MQHEFFWGGDTVQPITGTGRLGNVAEVAQLQD